MVSRASAQRALYLYITALLLAVTTPAPSAAEPVWERLGEGLDDSSLTFVTVDPHNPRLVYAASAQALYRSDDGGLHWQRCLRTAGNAEVTSVVLNPFDSSHVLVATSRGLYTSLDGAQHWSRVFRGSTAEETQGRVVVFHPARRHEVWLGTSGGLFVSRDGGRGWQSAAPDLSHRLIRFLTFDSAPPYRLYVVTDQEVFASEGVDASWRSLFSLIGFEGPVEAFDESLDASTSENAASSGPLTALAIDPASSATLYLSSLAGMYTSTDGGTNWQAVTRLGLGTSQINHVILHHHSPTVAYVATSKGVARYAVEDGRWEPLYAGLPAQPTHYLAEAPQKIFAATAQGLYLLDLTMERMAAGDWPDAKALLGNFVHEPTIGRVQETAIRYAEVHPEKIANWRKQARMSALIPKFTMTGDTNLTDFRHWDAGANPDALQKGERDVDWSANVTWELGQFIWSDDQTNIDVRSKLMVELRDSILDDVTRSYFERRRLQVELLTDPPAEPKAQLAKELRIQELTAILDGLTGGWFSHELDRNTP